jgi:ArsR family transcriptional regulator, arsenate/arsenite/antimonite-responsive transcriptional repressor
MTGSDGARAIGGMVDVFKAMSDPVRLELFTRIVEVPEMSCTQLVNEANVSASTVSYHVKHLKAADLVVVRKQGRNYYYTARFEALVHLRDLFADLAGEASNSDRPPTCGEPT